MLAKGYIGGTMMVAAGATALAIFMMVVTTPLTIGPIGVTAWFLVTLAALSSGIALIVYALEVWLLPKLPVKRRIRESTRRGLFVGGLITIILSLSSLKQLNIRDVLLIALLMVLVEFYVVARS